MAQSSASGMPFLVAFDLSLFSELTNLMVALKPSAQQRKLIFMGKNILLILIINFINQFIVKEYCQLSNGILRSR
jgi:hypothetical protein